MPTYSEIMYLSNQLNLLRARMADMRTSFDSMSYLESASLPSKLVDLVRDIVRAADTLAFLMDQSLLLQARELPSDGQMSVSIDVRERESNG